MMKVENSRDFFEKLYSKLKPSIKDLSNDLKFLYESKWMSDVTLILSSGSIRCHKAILYARSPVFAIFLEQSNLIKRDILIFAGVAESVMDVILRYVYSGDIRVFTQPGLRLDLAYDVAGLLELRCAKHFLSTQLTTMIAEKSLEHHLSFQVHLCNFSHSQVNIRDNYEYLFPSGITHGLDEWYLKIRLVQIRESEHFLGIFLVRKSRRRIIHLVFMNISLIDVDGNANLTYSDEYIFTRNTEFGTPLFVDRQTLRDECKKLLPNDTLTLTCNLSVIYDTNESGIGNFKTFRIPNAKYHTECFFEGFHCFSNNLQKFYEQKVYTDFSFHSRNTTYELHKCILTARTSLTIPALETLLSSLNRSALERYINFIYSGKNRYFKRCSLNIYSSACTLGLSSLQVKYSEFLARSLAKNNALKILRIAFTHNDENLKCAAMHFITGNRSILRSDEWIHLLFNNPHIAIEMRSYMLEKYKFVRFVYPDNTSHSALNLSRIFECRGLHN